MTDDATHASAFSLADLNTTIDQEPRILDLRLAVGLGFKTPLMIRKLIQRHLDALERLGEVLSIVEKTSICTSSVQNPERGLTFPFWPVIFRPWANVADNCVGHVREGGLRTKSGPRYVQGRTSYVQGESLKDVRRVLLRVISPGRQRRLINGAASFATVREGAAS